VTRIIAGAVGGRRIATPPGSGTRPTASRVREALFSSAEALTGALSGLRFLDLYAGSGAIGLEAWSRGAGVVTFVERDRPAAEVILANAATLGFGAADVICAPVASALAVPPAAPYDMVCLDPPYALPEESLRTALALLDGRGWLTPEAIVVVERGAHAGEPRWPARLRAVRSKTYGDTVLWYARAGPASAGSGMGG
jgi:16S rRNA (guanine966-N2)-methyltransferase